MDFGTIRRKLKEVAYTPVAGHVIHPKFIRDMKLVYNNCIRYNADGSPYNLHAQHMLALFLQKVDKKTAQLAADDLATDNLEPKKKKNTRAAADDDDDQDDDKDDDQDDDDDQDGNDDQDDDKDDDQDDDDD